jgi:hypothetical protein
MTRMRLSIVVAALLTAAAVVTGGSSPAGAEASVRTYRVTISNLTDGQPLTPPVLITHRKPFHAFEVGAPASVAVTELAENGNAAPLLDAASSDHHVADVVAGGMPIVPAANPGATPFPSTMTLMIDADQGAKYLSWVSMLICTNDGLTGLDAIRLPAHVGDSTVLETAGYDNGTEVNTEDFADIVPPCQALIGISSDDDGSGTSNPALAEGSVIHHHPGILGPDILAGADLLPTVHGWTDPVASVTIERVS